MGISVLTLSDRQSLKYFVLLELPFILNREWGGQLFRWVDVNDYVLGQQHGVKKMSIETGIKESIQENTKAS